MTFVCEKCKHWYSYKKEFQTDEYQGICLRFADDTRKKQTRRDYTCDYFKMSMEKGSYNSTYDSISKEEK